MMKGCQRVSLSTNLLGLGLRCCGMTSAEFSFLSKHVPTEISLSGSSVWVERWGWRAPDSRLIRNFPNLQLNHVTIVNS